MTNSAAKFMEYFYSRVMPQAFEVEKKRSKYFNIYAVWGLTVLGLSLLVGLSSLPAKSVRIDNLIFGLLLMIFPMFFLFKLPSGILKSMYALEAKERLLPLIIGFWGNFKYIAPTDLGYAILRSVRDKSGFAGFWEELKRKKDTNISVKPRTLARLFQFENISYDDKIFGKYKDTDIELSELMTYYTTSSGKSSSRHITFKGVVFSAVLNKKFNGLTIISNTSIDKGRAESPHFNLGMLSDEEYAQLFEKDDSEESAKGKTFLGLEFVPSDKVKKVINKGETFKVKDVFLEDPEFMKRFKVCSSDQVEARYILTTAFINRFLKMSESFKYKTKAIFMENNVYILVQAKKDWFEIPFTKPCNDVNNYREFLNDFTRLLAIVDTLKLNQNIGM